MISTTKIMNIDTKKIPLRQVIKQMPNPTKESVRKLYGNVGLDIFEGKSKITILPNNNKNANSLINRIYNWCIGNRKYDYEEKDSLNDLVLKHACNLTNDTSSEIENLLGQEGRKIADIYMVIGYLNRAGL
jgi:hypothetical protein